MAACLVTPATAGGGLGPCPSSVEAKGRNWTIVAPPPMIEAPWAEPLYAFAIDPWDTDVIFVTDSNTLYRSLDGGCSWKEVFSVSTASPQTPTTSCAGATDVDATGFPPCGKIYSIKISPTQAQPRNVYVSVSGLGYTGTAVRGSFLFRSQQSGDPGTFQPVIDTSSPDGIAATTGVASNRRAELFLTPADPDLLYLLRNAEAQWGVPARLYVSEDGGTTWKARPTTPGRTMADTFSSLAVSPVDPDLLWGQFFIPADATDTATSSLPVLHRSTDGGMSWTRSNFPRSPSVPADGAIISFAAGGETEQLFALTMSGFEVVLTEDGGASWKTSAASTVRPYRELAVSPDGRFLYLSNGADGVARVDLHRRLSTVLKSEPFTEPDRDDSARRLVAGANGMSMLVGCKAMELGSEFRCAALARYERKAR